MIWKNIEIEWKGELFTIRPDLEFMNHIEQRDGMSVGKMIIRSSNGDMPTSTACDLVARTLAYAGADVTPGDIFEATGGLSSELMEMASQILSACMPQPNAKKKPAAKEPATPDQK